MSEEWKVQASYKTPSGALLNIRADNLAELAGMVDEATKRSEFAGFFPQQVAGAPGTPTITDEQAIANIEKHLGPPATPAQVAVLVKRFNKTQEEAQALTKAQASEIISGGSK